MVWSRPPEVYPRPRTHLGGEGGEGGREGREGGRGGGGREGERTRGRLDIDEC